MRKILIASLLALLLVQAAFCEETAEKTANAVEETGEDAGNQTEEEEFKPPKLDLDGLSHEFRNEFAAMDKDGDTELNQDELKQAIPEMTEEDAKEFFEIADGDKNGKLSFDEYWKAILNAGATLGFDGQDWPDAEGKEIREDLLEPGPDDEEESHGDREEL